MQRVGLNKLGLCGSNLTTLNIVNTGSFQYPSPYFHQLNWTAGFQLSEYNSLSGFRVREITYGHNQLGRLCYSKEKTAPNNTIFI